MSWSGAQKTRDWKDSVRPAQPTLRVAVRGQRRDDGDGGCLFAFVVVVAVPVIVAVAAVFGADSAPAASLLAVLAVDLLLEAKEESAESAEYGADHEVMALAVQKGRKAG